ncbi:DUF4381 domain-containing protein [Idiomarina sp. HP20-50]|uniref:DUF4381 domain-containing protein n=1 Tax=Idiomarina sp. HP20-50 TaxID=3070813 RepID=UPI00294AC147|nr:DUF4381 domain-containing protein [Idiomarina sp. HP20-50]MDV6315530.1 DUF4381 domain-containing protein [Idiomarina sp. HP20-50]
MDGDNMIQQPSIEQLNDIVEPSQASWWPLSWLTIVVGLAVLATVITLMLALMKQRQKSRVRKAAIQQLSQNTTVSVNQLTILLKRTALAYYPRKVIAEKHSSEWLNFLLAPLSNRERQAFNQLPEQAEKNFYGVAEESFRQKYYQLAKLWLSKNLSKQPGANDV